MKYFWSILGAIGVVGFLVVYVYYWENGVEVGEGLQMVFMALGFIALFLFALLAPGKGGYKCIMCGLPTRYDDLYDNTIKGYGEICNNCVARRKRNQL